MQNDLNYFYNRIKKIFFLYFMIYFYIHLLNIVQPVQFNSNNNILSILMFYPSIYCIIYKHIYSISDNINCRLLKNAIQRTSKRIKTISYSNGFDLHTLMSVVQSRFAWIICGRRCMYCD